MSDEPEPTWLRDLRQIEELCHGDVELFITESKKVEHALRYYDGDLKRFARGRDKGARESISWRTMELYSKCSNDDLKFIRKSTRWRLGFYPHENVMVPASIYLCSLLWELRIDPRLTWKTFTERFDAHLKLVRSE